GYAPVTVFGEEIRDDVARLVHLPAGVRIDQIRKELLAAALAQARPVGRAALRTRVHDDIEIEDRERLARLAAERTRLELVELERLRGALAERADAHAAPEPADRGEQRGRDVEGTDHVKTIRIIRRAWRPRPSIASASTARPSRSRARPRDSDITSRAY